MKKNAKEEKDDYLCNELPYCLMIGAKLSRGPKKGTIAARARVAAGGRRSSTGDVMSHGNLLRRLGFRHHKTLEMVKNKYDFFF
ncbi:hypothetical protein KFK09_002618 [Dendrobium nobile]|uniref:Uncharacterized protein n=1 Tax=Dendrobium nobile TaxID=94219 RepID=A0A8T3C7C4_DENNO|nr:hypothetical protein KFK09_002618 [Dendrobium nobile]